MLHATELLGAATYDVHGNFVGRVRELFIEPADQPNRVARFLLARGKYPATCRALRSGRTRRARHHQAECRAKNRSRNITPMKAGWPCKRICSTSKLLTPAAEKSSA